MGGTCMGTNYNNSVVDKNLKVHLIKIFLLQAARYLQLQVIDTQHKQ